MNIQYALTSKEATLYVAERGISMSIHTMNELARMGLVKSVKKAHINLFDERSIDYFVEKMWDLTEYNKLIERGDDPNDKEIEQLTIKEDK